jgi:hypothetical protein
VVSSLFNTISHTPTRRLVSLYSDAHQIWAGSRLSTVYHSIVPKRASQSISHLGRVSTWRGPLDIDLSWIPFQSNDPINALIANTCCSHSSSCPHKRLAESIITNQCLIFEEDLLTVDAAGETLLHTAARWAAPLGLIAFLLTRINPGVQNLRGETFMHVIRSTHLFTFWERLPELLGDLLGREFRFHVLDCRGQTFLTRLFKDLEESLDSSIDRYYILDEMLNEENLYLLRDILRVEEASGTVAENLTTLLQKVEVGLRADGHHAQAGGARYHIHRLEAASSTNSPTFMIFEPCAFNAKGQTSVMAAISALARDSSPKAFASLRTALAAQTGSGNLRLKDSNGDTALHQALRLGLPASVVRLLLKHGADPMAPNMAGQTAYELAQDAVRGGKESWISKGFARKFGVSVAVKKGANKKSYSCRRASF